jgi:hypothetical protein
VSRGFVTWLALAVVVIVASRYVFVGLPLRRIAVRVTVTDAAFISVGLVGLAFHCGAMFFRNTAQRIPGSHSAIRAIDAMGTASRVWFIVPAILVVIGLRRQYPLALLAVAAALATVGATMYDHGPLRTHLTAIFLAVVIHAVVAATLVLPPWRQSPSRAPP